MVLPLLRHQPAQNDDADAGTALQRLFAGRQQVRSETVLVPAVLEELELQEDRCGVGED